LKEESLQRETKPISGMNMKSVRSIKGQTGRDRIRNKKLKSSFLRVKREKL
jgi:hypothetical protein